MAEILAVTANHVLVSAFVLPPLEWRLIAAAAVAAMLSTFAAGLRAAA